MKYDDMREEAEKKFKEKMEELGKGELGKGDNFNKQLNHTKTSKEEMKKLIMKNKPFRRIMFKLSKAGADTAEISQDWEVQGLICREEDELTIFNFFGGTKWLEKECYLGERVGTFHTHGKSVWGSELGLSLGDVLSSMESKDNLVCVGELKGEKAPCEMFFR